MSKKDTVVVQERAPIVPVSQTHRVSTVRGEVLSAYEADLERRQTELRGVEDQLLQDSMEVLSGALQFANIDFDATAPTKEFVEEMVAKGKDPDKAFRIIKSAQMKSSEAPVGLMLAQKTAMGILKARAADKGAPKPLAVAIQVVTTMPQFKEIEEK